MKKSTILISVACIIGLSYIAYRQNKQSAKTAEFSIGIIQTASHPALDAARDGFVSTLKNRLGDRVDFLLQNAQGSIDTLQVIAQRMHAKSTLTGFYAIATPALQAIAGTVKKRPIVFAAVTDPNTLGLENAANITGARDMIHVPKTIAMIQQLTPQVKTIALLYTNAEENSVVMVKEMRKILEARGLAVLDVPIANQADIAVAVESACRKADALLAPTDNNVAAAIDLIASIALNNKKPLYVSDNLLVSHGALAARGIDYTQNGIQAANLMIDILLEGKNPRELSVEQPASDKIYLNKNTLDKLGLIIPENVKEHITLVD